MKTMIALNWLTSVGIELPACMTGTYVGRDEASKRLGYRVEGRASWGRFPTETVDLARQLKAQGKSLRQISAELAKRGQLNNAGKPYGPQSIARMLRGGEG